MRSSFPTPRPRWIAITAAVVSVLAVLALLTAPPTEVSEDDALAAFRDQVAENDRVTSETPTAPADTTPSLSPSPVEPTPAADAAGDETADDAEQSAEPEPEPTDVAEEPADDSAAQPDEPEPSPTATTPAAPQHTRPQQGVYRFSVDGQESLDVPGGSREHPSSATATIVHQNDGCGWTSTVTLSEERQDTFEFCTSGDGHTMRRVGSYVEFFGQGEQQDFVCAPELDLPGGPSDATTSTTCTDADAGARANITASFVETGTRTIGGVTVEAVRLQYEVRFSGSMEGRSSIDIWIHGTTGALLWMDRDTDTMVQTQAGRRRYQEQVVVELRDVKPRS